MTRLAWPTMMDDNEALFRQIIKKQTMTPEEQGFLIRYISKPENKDKYHLTTELHDDRIGKYRILTIDPRAENHEKVKIYMIPKNGLDLTAFKIQYYDLLRCEKSNSFKALRLSLLVKNMELTFARELKIHARNGRFEDVYELLQKMKKARSYYSYKMLLDSKITTDENGVQEIRTSRDEEPVREDDDTGKTENQKTMSRSDDRGSVGPEESPSTAEQDAG